MSSHEIVKGTFAFSCYRKINPDIDSHGHHIREIYFHLVLRLLFRAWGAILQWRGKRPCLPSPSSWLPLKGSICRTHGDRHCSHVFVSSAQTAQQTPHRCWKNSGKNPLLFVALFSLYLLYFAMLSLKRKPETKNGQKCHENYVLTELF